jgi:hypothetical protein
MKGYISLHRQVQEHWLWKEKRKLSRFEAWTDILLNVNHTEARIIIKNTIYNVGRGESVMSLKNWADRWNWTRSSVKRFLSLLENDEMIQMKSDTNTTHLTICKYDSYQSTRNSNETKASTKRTSSEHQVNTNNNDNNDNNENNNKIEASQIKSFKTEILSETQQKNIIAKAKSEVEKRGGKWACNYNFNPYDVLGRQFTNFNKICVDGKWTFNNVNHIKNSFYIFVVEYWDFNYDDIVSKMKTKYKKKYTKK